VPAAAPPPETTLPVLPPLVLPAGSVSLLSTADLALRCRCVAVRCGASGVIICWITLSFSPARPPGFEICGVVVCGSLRGGFCCGRDCGRRVFSTEEIEGSQEAGGGRK
jgi:hypothetical protein